MDNQYFDKRDNKINRALDHVYAGNSDGLPVYGNIGDIRYFEGGKSGCTTAEVVTDKGVFVLKTGSFDLLQKEWKAYNSHLKTSNNYFSKFIGTCSCIKNDTKPSIERDDHCIICQHVAAAAGHSQARCKTLEERIREVLTTTNENDLTGFKTEMNGFIQGISEVLFFNAKPASIPLDKFLYDFNTLLGKDLDIEALDPTMYEGGEDMFYIGTQSGMVKTLGSVHPRDIFYNSFGIKNNQLTDFESYLFIDLRIGEKVEQTAIDLVCDIAGTNIKIKVNATPGNRTFSDDLVQKLKELKDKNPETAISVAARLPKNQGRFNRHRNFVANYLSQYNIELFAGFLGNDDYRVPDPFRALTKMAEDSKSTIESAVSAVHGDLTPRNILFVPKESGYTSMLIDYGKTRDNFYMLSDFARMEGMICREMMPEATSWEQMVQFQRFLALASRLPLQHESEAVGRIIGEMKTEIALDSEARACLFDILLTIRQASRRIFPADTQKWYKDYLNQLFLFSHLSFKWQHDKTPVRVMASAVMAGVAVEASDWHTTYMHWGKPDFSKWCEMLCLFIADNPREALFHLPALAVVLNTLKEEQEKAGLNEAFKTARIAWLKHEFKNKAKEVKGEMGYEHHTFINIAAFIDLKATLISLDKNKEKTEKEGILEIFNKNDYLIVKGSAGSGKSTISGEWAYQLAGSIAVREFDDRDVMKIQNPKFPVNIKAADIIKVLKESPFLPIEKKPKSSELLDTAVIINTLKSIYKNTSNGDNIARLNDILDIEENFTIGAFHLNVDALNEIEGTDRRTVAAWIKSLTEIFPRTSVFTFHREFNFAPDIQNILNFDIVKLEKVDEEQAKKYIKKYCGESGRDENAENLINLLFHDQAFKRLRELAKTPLFLWMLAKHFSEKREIARERGRFFEDFSKDLVNKGIRAKKDAPPFEPKFSEEDKRRVLELIGYTLVEDGNKTTIRRSEMLQLGKQVENIDAIIEELIQLEVLIQEKDSIGFFHQSFQEYFAAQYFLAHKAVSEAHITDMVKRHQWFDMLAVLSAFMGSRPDVINWIVTAYLKYDRIKAAECLRVSENPDEKLLLVFIDEIKGDLSNPQSGKLEKEECAKAMGAHGRGIVRKAMIDMLSDPGAPVYSRIELLKNLQAMLKKEQFSDIKDRIEGELIDAIKSIYREGRYDELDLAALKCIAETPLEELFPLILNRVFVQNKFRSLDHYLESLALSEKVPYLEPGNFSIEGVKKSLSKEEDLLYNRDNSEDRVKLLVNTRKDALSKIAEYSDINLVAENIEIFLRRRFNFMMQDHVHGLIDKIISNRDLVSIPDKTKPLFAILKGVQQRFSTTDLIKTIEKEDDLIAAAAGHKLIGYIENQGEPVPANTIKKLLTARIAYPKLQIIAEIIRKGKIKEIADYLEQFLKDQLRIVHDQQSREAWAVLFQAYKDISGTRQSTQLFMVSHYIFLRYQDDSYPFRHPLLLAHSGFSPTDEDYSAILNRGGDDALAAVWFLAYLGGTITFLAERGSYFTDLSPKAQKALLALTEQKHSSLEKWRICNAFIQANVIEAIPWILKEAKNPELYTSGPTIHHASFQKRITETHGCVFQRACGYFARRLRDQGKEKDAEALIRFLTEKKETIPTIKNTSIVNSLCIGLGYLGDWKPVLENLQPDQPWMCKAAENIFNFWVSKEIEDQEADAVWIKEKMNDKNLSTDVRDCYQRIYKYLCSNLGYYP